MESKLPKSVSCVSSTSPSAPVLGLNTAELPEPRMQPFFATRLDLYNAINVAQTLVLRGFVQ